MYIMLSLFDVVENKIIIAISLEKLSRDLLQSFGIRYDSISLSVRFDYFSWVSGKIDFWCHTVYFGTPKP